MGQIRFQPLDSTVFLALVWSGGGAHSLPELIGAYDWVNRNVLDRAEMAGALNRLLAARLIERRERNYAVPSSVYRRFAAFRQRRRRGRFRDAEAFVRSHEPLPSVRPAVRLTQTAYARAVEEYHRTFAEALKSLLAPGIVVDDWHRYLR